jgi:hypothetical protein
VCVCVCVCVCVRRLVSAVGAYGMPFSRSIVQEHQRFGSG